MLCYAMLCYAMLCYVMLCYVMLCYVLFWYISICLLYAMSYNKMSRRIIHVCKIHGNYHWNNAEIVASVRMAALTITYILSFICKLLPTGAPSQ
jgi:hypothetical protein